MTDDDLEALLRQADPAADLAPLTSLRITQLLEDTMSTDIQTTPHTPAPASRRPRVGLLVAASAALLLAGGGFFALGGFGHSPASATKHGPAATVTQLTVGAVNAKCAAPTSEVLATVQVAFEGTVRTIEGGVVTLVPSTFFAGPATDTVTLAQTDGASDVLLGGSNTFKIGSTYLVAANGGQVQACYSGEATPELQSLYEATF